MEQSITGQSNLAKYAGTPLLTTLLATTFNYESLRDIAKTRHEACGSYYTEIGSDVKKLVVDKLVDEIHNGDGVRYKRTIKGDHVIGAIEKFESELTKILKAAQ